MHVFVFYFLLIAFSILVYFYLAIQPLGCKSVQ